MPRYSRTGSRNRNSSRYDYDDLERNDTRRNRSRQSYSGDRTRYDRYNNYSDYGRRNGYAQDEYYRPMSDTGYDSDYFDDTLTGKVINKVNRNTEKVKEKRKKKRKKEIITVKDTSVQYENAELQREYVNIRTGREVQLG